MSSGAWQQLKENLALAKTKKPQELGVDGAVPPDPMAIEKIRHKFHNMRKTYSPEKKVSLLLRVCKLIYTIMQDNSGKTSEIQICPTHLTFWFCLLDVSSLTTSMFLVCFLPGRMYGADDFLPMLTYVVAQCDMPQLDTEIQYMMELLDPSLLQGEGGRCAGANGQSVRIRKNQVIEPLQLKLVLCPGSFTFAAMMRQDPEKKNLIAFLFLQVSL